MNDKICFTCTDANVENKATNEPKETSVIAFHVIYKIKQI